MALLLSPPARAEYLFVPGANATPNSFQTPAIDFDGLIYEYSAWDIFYAPHTLANYPDIFAPYGGLPGANPGEWTPEQRSAANLNPQNAGYGTFPVGAGIFNPADPLAFWDTRNPTITQTGTNTTFIIGPDISGNIYSFQQKTSYVLANNPDYDQLGTVIFQFHTDGALVDFSKIKLVWNDGVNDHTIYATEAEYLREYRNTASGHWSASGGYSNRVAIQWDMTEAVDQFGDPITSYKIYWEAESSSMSFQKADLVTADTYDAGIPAGATWVGATGNWNQSGNWQMHSAVGTTLPQANGNIRFDNTSPAVLTINDGHHTVGEVIFESASNVTINSLSGYRLTSNTGVTTRDTATGNYTINSNFALGALNFFEINAGTVNMNGVISGAYGIVKSGDGTLVLGNNNTFTGFLGVQDGTIVVNGTNAYTGGTTVINGRLVLGADAGATGALGNSSSEIALGADAGLYAYIGGGQVLMAEIMLNGNRTLSRDIGLAAGDFGKRLGGMNATGGATFSGNIVFGTTSSNPDSADSAAGEVYLTAQNASDVVRFSGQLAGGSTSKRVIIDGEGTVAYTGVNKTYQNATLVKKGTLLIDSGVALTGNGNVTVDAGAKLKVNGTLGGTGQLAVSGTISGTGTVQRGFSIANGATISPGNSVGTLTVIGDLLFGGGGVFSWEMQNASGDEGTGWDLLTIEGKLNITATSANRFEVELVTLNLSGVQGIPTGFDPYELYDWTILTALDGIVGFSADKFSLDLASFVGPHSSNFSIGKLAHGDGSESLVLHYNPVAVPEPGRSMLLFFAAATALLRRRRRPSFSI
ncbi:autotransporter-associated beta strand repeat-containing protein [Roseimicrobium sp. ORNL1]|uniref:autotransporter-associated beta strand repeat-containing protein n=1 Tax=Roseimicrobium sp. ORNL1 TaxID=2711231 RepID=UPI001981560D|nr:autotransporter-associated beta strand repeat-containing protein [Roseimicrobium sp. ORNL1]